MADTPIWISLAELADMFGISTLHCNRVLEHQGWRDRHGQPTPAALEAHAAHNHGPGGRSRQTLWNKSVCSAVFKAQGYKATSRKQQVRQWAQFLEAMDVGSPSISTTADQMAADVPQDLVSAVNDQLAARGCRYRISSHQHAQARHGTAC